MARIYHRRQQGKNPSIRKKIPKATQNKTRGKTKKSQAMKMKTKTQTSMKMTKMIKTIFINLPRHLYWRINVIN